ncbi:tetratricopeptide repeat protein [Patescibacteria group bacterium]
MTNKKAFLPYIVVGTIIVIVIILAFVFKSPQDDQITVNIDTSSYLQQIDQYDLNEAQTNLYNEIQKDLQGNPNDLETVTYLGTLFYTLENYETAEEIYVQVVKYEPQNTVALQNLANTYRNTNRYQLAEDTFYQILDYNILWLPALETLAELYRFELRPSNDIYPEILIQAREVDYNDQYEQPLLKMLAFYYKYQGDNDISLEYFTEYVGKYPEDNLVQEVYDELKNQ